MSDTVEKSNSDMDKSSPSKCSRVLIVTPSSEAAMHVSGGVAKVCKLTGINISKLAP